MAINFIPFEELFAPEYQLTYISTDGHIDVGPNTYSVFHYYTMTERQQIFQVCEKHLPWEHTEEQEQWERTMYMYQYIIKSPPPFPYEEYPLSEEIIMAITWEVIGLNVLDVPTRAISLTVERVDDSDPLNIKKQQISIISGTIASATEKLAIADNIWEHHLAYDIKQEQIDSFIDTFKTDLKTNLEGRES